MYTSPGFYQSPYTQPAQNPYMDRLAQMQPPRLLPEAQTRKKRPGVMLFC